ncbi:thiamine pyrophosphate-dependent enzyme [Candidatus Enterococcus clewellii]|uniref:Acetolactate synthase I/II/III large subunit n=1 Tax=Candidatus Enterococcus clewellii TaxID=1834193 RepID=A0A242K1Y5_9ENTE|nr:thiamine pyrophosphate-dependent enzyme [Enterococcus sp. 9E7_DIV0242]OTP11671.1 hypothetical protein A5888_003770 [Enterococcus sp. 9E7_DIV0242]
MKSPKTDGFKALSDFLSSLKINLYSGVTGGGVIHFLKYLGPYKGSENSDSPAFFTLSEYAAGFTPLGYYLATGQVSAAVATTGAATKLLACGLSDGKLHDIPSVYLFPVSNISHAEDEALQDTSIYGSNIVQQLRAEFPEQVFLLDNVFNFKEQLKNAEQVLMSRKPVVFLLDNETMMLPNYEAVQTTTFEEPDDIEEIKVFLKQFKEKTDGKRVILLVGEEGIHDVGIRKLTTAVCKELKAAAVWSMNGGNCVEADNPYGYGYISFGGNDRALDLWSSISEEDVVLCVGASPDEYTTDLKKIKANDVFFINNIPNAYGQIRGSFQHGVAHNVYQISAPITEVLQSLINEGHYATVACPKAPENLNDRDILPPRKGFADMEKVYKRLYDWWQPDSLIISDVCLVYKDYQYVTQRPNENITYFSFYRGSAMGGAYGVAVGAKLGAPDKRVYLFSGDGCFRLYGGSLEEAKNLGIVLFLINNQNYSIVSQGLPKILPDVKPERYHDDLNGLDYCKVAEASGWLSYSVATDLSNFDEILSEIEKNETRSILVNIPVDPEQILGQNPRVRNL